MNTQAPVPTTEAMPLPLANLLPLKSLTVTLRFIESSYPGEHHYVPLNGFVKNLLKIDKNSQGQFSRHFCIRPPEKQLSCYHANDLYSFQVILLPGCDDFLVELIQQLRVLPNSITKTDEPMHFRNNVKLKSIKDSFTGRTICEFNRIICEPKDYYEWGIRDLVEESLKWSGKKRLIWEWISPARLKLPDGQSPEYGKSRQQNNAFKYCRNSTTLTPELLLGKVYGSFRSLLAARMDISDIHRDRLPVLTLDKLSVSWRDARYITPNGTIRKSGGLCGYLQLSQVEFLHFNWWCLLVLGQYLGIGESRVFGMGHYKLKPID